MQGPRPCLFAPAKNNPPGLWPFAADSVIERAIPNDPTLPASLSRGFFGVRSGRPPPSAALIKYMGADTSPAKAGEEKRSLLASRHLLERGEERREVFRG